MIGEKHGTQASDNCSFALHSSHISDLPSSVSCCADSNAANRMDDAMSEGMKEERTFEEEETAIVDGYKQEATRLKSINLKLLSALRKCVARGHHDTCSFVLCGDPYECDCGHDAGIDIIADSGAIQGKDE